jgi:tRNA modification GTPase
LIQNKIDLDPQGYDQKFCDDINKQLDPKIKVMSLGISTKESDSLIPLKKQLNDVVQSLGNTDGIIINNSRHFHALTEALHSIGNVKKGILSDLPGDLLSIDLKEAIDHVGTITGVIDTDHDILGTIFNQFCIGK